jgi:hypothetical protein
VGGLNRSGYGVAAKAGKGASWAVLSGLCYKSFIRPEIVAETAIKSTSHAQNAGSNRPVPDADFRGGLFVRPPTSRRRQRQPKPIAVVVRGGNLRCHARSNYVPENHSRAGHGNKSSKAWPYHHRSRHGAADRRAKPGENKQGRARALIASCRRVPRFPPMADISTTRRITDERF